MTFRPLTVARIDHQVNCDWRIWNKARPLLVFIGMKNIVSYSAVLTSRRFVGFLTVMALAALPALGAGSAKQPVEKGSDPSITIYNQGVELMLAKKFPQAEAKFEQ